MTLARVGKALYTVTAVLGYFVLGAFFVVMCSDLHGDEGLSSGALLAGILSSAPIMLFTIAAHEYGHAVVARLTGHPVLSIEIGTGPRLAHWGSDAVTTVRLFPSGGLTRIGAAPPGVRGPRHACWYVAAGPLTNAALAGISIALAVWLTGLPAFFAAVFSCIQVGVVLASLWPKKSGRSGHASDGWRLWQFRPWGWLARLRRLNARSDEGDAIGAYRSLASRRTPRGWRVERNAYLALHAYRAGFFEDSARLHEGMLERDGLDERARARLRAISAECLLSAALRDGVALDEMQLDRCSAALYSRDLAPVTPIERASLAHSLALLLLARDDPAAAMDAGRKILAFYVDALKPVDRAIVAAMTAIAAARTGEIQTASDWAAQVPEWCALWPAMQRELAGRVPSSVG